MRFKIIFPVESGTLVALGDTRIDRAIEYARRIAEGDWFEIVDTHTGNVVASSRTDG